jgi:choline dehydrogenase-like flavoprotein
VHPFNRYNGLNGSSTSWPSRIMPLSSSETCRRDHVGLSAWPVPPEELTRHHGDINTLFGFATKPADGSDLLVRDPSHIMPPSNSDFDALRAEWPDLPHGSLLDLYGKQVQSNRNIDFWQNTAVKSFDVDVESGRLRSVIACDAYGKRLSVRADHFVLATGTIETTRLLLWLDASTGGHSFAHTSALGVYLQNQILVRVARMHNKGGTSENVITHRVQRGNRSSLHLNLTPAAQQDGGGASAFACFTEDRKQPARHSGAMAWTQIIAGRSRMQQNADSYVEIGAEQLPDERNFIELSRKRDAVGLPKAKLHWRPMLADERTLRNATDRLAAYWRRHKLDRNAPLEWVEACRNPDGQVSDAAVDYAHPSGTARMGTNRNSSVVGPDLVCHDVPNLSVVSAAVLPSIGSVDPLFTLVALAMRHADALLARHARFARTRLHPPATQPSDGNLSTALS